MLTDSCFRISDGHIVTLEEQQLFFSSLCQRVLFYSATTSTTSLNDFLKLRCNTVDLPQNKKNAILYDFRKLRESITASNFEPIDFAIAGMSCECIV